jgi:hypothetical protein
MVDLSDAAHDEAIRNAGWDPKPLRSDECPEDYPLHRLPGIIGKAVREVADYVQAPVALVAASALSVVSAAVQTKFSVSRDSRMHGPASLYFLTVAESGERKSTVDGIFMKPIRDWEVRQRREAGRLEQEYRESLDEWEQAEGDRGEKPEKPSPTPKMLRGDDTSEALVNHLVQYPVAAVICAEAGVIFGSHSMKAENVQRNMGLANALWDGGPVMEGRIGRGEIFIQSARVTMGLMLQPTVLENLVTQGNGVARGIGYLARFLFCHPESTQGSRFYRDPPPMQGLEEFQQRVTQLLEHHAVFDELGNLSTYHMGFDERATASWINFYNAVEDELGGDRDYSVIRGEANKAADNAARIACCLQVFTAPNAAKIDLDTMNHACALMRWYLDEAVRFGRAAEATEELRHAELLEVWLIDQHKKLRREKTEWNMTVNMIRQKGPNALRGSKRVDGALELLKDYGRIRVISPSGTKSQYVLIAPQVIAEYS